MEYALIDYLLYFLIVATMAIILWKTADLFLKETALGKWAFEKNEYPETVAKNTGNLEDVENDIDGLEKGLNLLSAIAATAPFIGLAGTVLHIMAALSGLKSTEDMSVIVGPVTSALHATLLGLYAAIPAAAAYNLMVRRIERLEDRAMRILRKKDANKS